MAREDRFPFWGSAGGDRGSGNAVFLSAVSAWEMQIKAQLGKPPLPGTMADLVKKEMQVNGFQPLPVRFDHVYALDDLPPHHKDPFDRLLVAQAQREEMTLVGDDAQVQKYDVPVLW